MIHTMCIIKFPCTQGNATNNFIQCLNTYMYTTHVINSIREQSEILKKVFLGNYFFLTIIDIKINIIFKI